MLYTWHGIIYIYIYSGITRSSGAMVDLFEPGKLHPPFHFGADARAAYDAVVASDVRHPAESSFKLHLVSVRDRLSHSTIGNVYWLDIRDVVADDLTTGVNYRCLLDNMSNDCRYEVKHETFAHAKSSLRVGSATVAGENLRSRPE